MKNTAQTLHEVLYGHAEKQDGASLLIAPETGAQLSYGELARQTERFGRWAAGRGLQAGDRIAMLLPNGMQAGLIFLASMVNGYVIVPLNLLATPAQLLHCLRHSRARMVVTCADLAASLRKVLPELAGGDGVPEVIEVDPDENRFAQDGPARAGAQAPAPADMALLMYTSGTTGIPKGVPLSHANLLHGARSVANWHGRSRTTECCRRCRCTISMARSSPRWRLTFQAAALSRRAVSAPANGGAWSTAISAPG